MKLLAVALAGIVLLLLCGAVATLVIARVIETRYPPAGRFVEVAGGRLHVVEMAPQGREPEATVLLLHGASGSSGDPMTALGERLARRFRVVAVDRPGSGWSDRIGGAEAASPATQARVIRAALREIGIERVIVVGHSWAGALALNLALDHADLVSGLVLLAPVSHPWPGGGISWYYGPATWPVAGRLLTWTLATPAGLLLMGPTVGVVFAPQAPPPDYVARSRSRSCCARVRSGRMPRTCPASTPSSSSRAGATARSASRPRSSRATPTRSSGRTCTRARSSARSRARCSSSSPASAICRTTPRRTSSHARSRPWRQGHRRTTAQPQPPWHLSNGAMDKVELRRLTLLVLQFVPPAGPTSGAEWQTRLGTVASPPISSLRRARAACFPNSASRPSRRGSAPSSPVSSDRFASATG